MLWTTRESGGSKRETWMRGRREVGILREFCANSASQDGIPGRVWLAGSSIILVSRWSSTGTPVVIAIYMQVHTCVHRNARVSATGIALAVDMAPNPHTAKNSDIHDRFLRMATTPGRHR